MRSLVFISFVLFPLLCEAGVPLYPWRGSWHYNKSWHSQKGKGKSNGRSVNERSTFASPSVLPFHGYDDMDSILDHGYLLVYYYEPQCLESSSECLDAWSAFEDVASKNGRNDIYFGQVDCSETVNKEMCWSHDVNTYPTTHLYEVGSHQGTTMVATFSALNDVINNLV
ncbi:uncharacterized protein LOC144452363 [Glandiceps talaboti]